MLLDSKYLPFCVRLRTEKILSSKIRYFDLLILIPNVIFFLFLITKWIRTRAKLNTNKPLLLSVTCLLLSITSTNIVRCAFVMIFPDHAFHAQEIVVKILWLGVQWTLLWTELSVLLFGICFGPSKPNRQSIRTIKILLLSFLLTAMYISVQATLEFRNDARPIRFQTSTYNLYSHGGMTFLLISSSTFLTIYSLLFVLSCACRQQRKRLPIRPSFYIYCFVLACINLTQVVGTALNLTETTIYSMCMVEGTTCVFYVCFAPFVYYQFLRRALSSKVLVPEIIYADSTLINPNDDDDDLLINPGVNRSIDSSTEERLDGQFEDISASTNIIQPVL